MILSLNKPIDVERANGYLSKLIAGAKKIELKEIRDKRSLSQNAYLHLILTWFAVEFGYTLEESKTIYKRNYNPDIFIYEKKETKFLRSSSDLDSKEMTESIERFRTKISMETGFYIPSPDDHKFECFKTDTLNREQYAKQYL